MKIISLFGGSSRMETIGYFGEILCFPAQALGAPHKRTSGVDIKTVKNRAGHTRIETTMSYTHPWKNSTGKSPISLKSFYETKKTLQVNQQRYILLKIGNVKRQN